MRTFSVGLKNALRSVAPLGRARAPVPHEHSMDGRVPVLHKLHAFFSVQEECSQRASRAGENQECDQRHDEGENHDEGEALGRVEQFENLLHMRIRAVGGVLLNVVEKGVVDFFSRAESGPERENRSQDAEPDAASECAEARSHSSGEMS